MACVYANSAASDTTTSTHRIAAAKLHRRWRRNSHSRKRRSAGLAAASSAGRRALNHSRITTSAATPRITTKKKTSLRTIGPTVAISALLDHIHCASLNSCTPVSASWNAITIRMTLVARKKRCSGIRSVPWKKKMPTPTAIAIPSSVPIHTWTPAVESSTARRISTSSAPSRTTMKNTNAPMPHPAARVDRCA